MDATKLQEDYPIATPEYVKKLLEDYPITTPEHVMELQKACPYVSLQDVVNCILSFGPDTVTWPPSPRRTELFLSWFDYCIHDININRKNEELNGRLHVNAGPLLYIHSVQVQPKKALKNQQLAVYGRIQVCFQDITSGKRMKLDLYKRRAKDAEIISSDGGNLTLSWPHEYPWTKLQGTTIVVKLYHKILGKKGVLFAKEDIFVGDATKGNFEELISKKFHSEVCCAVLTYIAMPFAALCRVDVRLCGKEKDRVVNVAGKIVARYKNTYGNYKSEPCVLFEKQNGFEPVLMNDELRMSRAWLGLPAYSSLELDLDLRDYDTNRKIKRRVELLTGNGPYAYEYAEASDDFAIVVDARLFPYPLNEQPGWSDYDTFEALSLLSFGIQTPSSISGYRWRRFKVQPSVQLPSRLAEFYSIFIGCKKKPALKIAGIVEFSSDNKTYYIFKSNGNDGVEVEDPQKVLPLKGACMKFDLYGTLELKVNLQDVGGKFANRGFATYKLRSAIPYNIQICSVFPGKDGFCALHYSFFPRACQASIEIILKIKSLHSGVERIYGSAIAQYSNFDYSTEFKRDYFRSVLFRRTKKDPVQLENDGAVPLSRNVVAVPMDSSLVIEVDFCGVSMKDHLFCNGRFEIGHWYFKEETNDYDLQIKVTWGDGLQSGRSELDEDKGAHQMRTSIKRKQPDQHIGGSDFDEDEIAGWVKRIKRTQDNASSKSNLIRAQDVVVIDEDEAPPVAREQSDETIYFRSR